MRDRTHILGVGPRFRAGERRHRELPDPLLNGGGTQGAPVRVVLALAALFVLTVLAAFLTGARTSDHKDSRDFSDERPPMALSSAEPTLRSGRTLPWPLVLSGGPAFWRDAI